MTNLYTANNLNQYTSILRNSVSPCEPSYDIDGNLLTDGVRTFTYDAANRLKTVSTNGILVLTNFYDAKSRRVRKVTPNATTTFFYDDWNLIEERVAYTNGTISTIHYYWGKDLSGTLLQGAGGVGGLLYLTINDSVYIPFYDNNGNITRYLDATGNTVAQYTYDAFGNTISQSGSLANIIRHRFSTKYIDSETGLYYYGYRFYHPILMRWLTRDPIGEEGGENIYAFCLNNPTTIFDLLGLLTSSEAFDHYKSGPDDPNDSTKRVPIRISFDEINTSEVKVIDFPAVKRLLSEKKAGKHPVTWKNKKDNLPFSTSGDQSLYLGNVSLKLEGILEIKTDCTWTFAGTLKCFDDLYDFNASTHRSAIGEWLTSIGRETKGKPFYVEIRGEKAITESGTLEAKSSKWRIY